MDSFLESVVSIIETCPRGISCTLWRGVENPAFLAIIEEWERVDAHRAAASAIPPAKLAEAAALFAKPPSGTYYEA